MKTILISCSFLAFGYLNIPAPILKDVTTIHLPQKDLSSNTMDIVTADLDGDGKMDIILASEFRQNLVYLNNGKGTYTDVTAAALPERKFDSEDIAAADFDKDGDIDLVFVSEDTYVHEYYLNNGKGVFTDVSDRIRIRSKANAVLEGDFDNDGDIDLILGNEGQDVFLANDGKGFFTDETTSHLPVDNSTTQDIESADLDGDKDIDLVLGNEDGNKIYMNHKGKFSEAMKVFPEANEETRKVDLADVDGDGDIDIFFSNVNFLKVKDPSNRLLINNGKGVFTDESATRYLGTNNYHTTDVSFGDMDGDKDKDLVVANVFNGVMQYFENNGKGVFTEKPQVFADNPSADAISVEVADFNMDGKMDVMIGGFRSRNVLLVQ